MWLANGHLCPHEGPVRGAGQRAQYQGQGRLTTVVKSSYTLCSLQSTTSLTVILYT